MAETSIGNWSALMNGHAFTQYFFAVFPDGREERITGVTLANGETLADAIDKLRIEIGATHIILKPVEAPAMVG